MHERRLFCFFAVCAPSRVSVAGPCPTRAACGDAIWASGETPLLKPHELRAERTHPITLGVRLPGRSCAKAHVCARSAARCSHSTRSMHPNRSSASTCAVWRGMQKQPQSSSVNLALYLARSHMQQPAGGEPQLPVQPIPAQGIQPAPQSTAVLQKRGSRSGAAASPARCL